MAPAWPEGRWPEHWKSPLSAVAPGTQACASWCRLVFRTTPSRTRRTFPSLKASTLARNEATSAGTMSLFSERHGVYRGWIGARCPAQFSKQYDSINSSRLRGSNSDMEVAGGQKMTCGRSFQRHLKQFDLPTEFTEWARLAQNRAGWHKLVTTPPFAMASPSSGNRGATPG